MKLPIQAKPISRNVLEQSKNVDTVSQSGLCEMGCNLLPEPVKSICKAAC